MLHLDRRAVAVVFGDSGAAHIVQVVVAGLGLRGADIDEQTRGIICQMGNGAGHAS